jgi:SAM-dependent methyltransferase
MMQGTIMILLASVLLLLMPVHSFRPVGHFRAAALRPSCLYAVDPTPTVAVLSSSSLPDDLTSTLAPLAPAGAAALGGAALLFKLGVYWRMQFVSAAMVSGIPRGSTVVELDAQDGKNVFYLGEGVQYTAVMSSGSDDDSASKRKEKERINNQLILESIGKANRGGLNLQGKVRSRTAEIPSKSVDVVVSTGAVARAGGLSAAVELVNEAYRVLRPGGLFVFCDADGRGDVIEAVTKVFPATITSSQSAGDKAKKRKAAAGNDDDGGKKKKRKSSKAEAMAGSGSTGGNDANASNDDDDNVDSAEQGAGDSGSAEEAGESVPAAAVTRPGISYERLANLFDPYVTGIAVRP